MTHLWNERCFCTRTMTNSWRLIRETSAAVSVPPIGRYDKNAIFLLRGQLLVHSRAIRNHPRHPARPIFSQYRVICPQMTLGNSPPPLFSKKNRSMRGNGNIWFLSSKTYLTELIHRLKIGLKCILRRSFFEVVEGQKSERCTRTVTIIQCTMG